MRAPVYLVRHGQSEWNAERLTQGQTKHPALTELGRAQAAEAAEVIATDVDRAGLVVGRFLTSDLVRAVETAAVVGRRIGLRAEPDVRLREQHLGTLQGMAQADSWALAELHDWSDPELPVAGGESAGDVRRRVAAVLADLDPAVPTVIVSHGDAIRSALGHLQGHAVTDAPWVEVPNGAVLRFDGAATRLPTTQPPNPREYTSNGAANAVPID